MKKIGLLLRTEPFSGGAFQYCQALLNALVLLPRDQYTIIVCYAANAWSPILKSYQLEATLLPQDKLGRIVDKLGRVFSLPASLMRFIAPVFLKSVKILSAQQCDMWIFPSEDSLSYQSGLPAIVTIFDIMHRYEPRFPELTARGEFKRRDSNCFGICRWAKTVLVDSEIGKTQVIESYGVSAEKVAVLPYIAPRYIYDSHFNASEFDSKYLLPKKYIFYPAQFWEHKNHANLLRAVALLKRKIPNIKLVLVGSKKNGYDLVKKLIVELNLSDDVTMPGYVPDHDMPEFYRRARAMIMPTFLGPTNIPPLEAFAMGCPVAVSNVYAMPEQVGDAALLFNPASVDSIADVLSRLWVDDALCAALSKKGKDKDASWNIDQFSESLRSIIDLNLSNSAL